MKRVHPYKLTLYIRSEDERIVRDFVQAIKARNENASQKIVDYIKEVMIEGKINPQKRLIDLDISNIPCIFHCGRNSEFIASYGNDERRFKVCGVHADCIRHNSLKRNFLYKNWMIVGEIKP